MGFICNSASGFSNRVVWRSFVWRSLCILSEATVVNVEGCHVPFLLSFCQWVSHQGGNRRTYLRRFEPFHTRVRILDRWSLSECQGRKNKRIKCSRSLDGTVNKVYRRWHKVKLWRTDLNNRMLVHLIAYRVLTKYTSNSGVVYFEFQYNS